MSQLITLNSGLAATAGGMSHLRESVKLKWRALRNRQTTFGWLQLLNSHPLFLDLVRALNELLGISLQPTHAPARTGDIRFSRADISRACRDLGYQPAVSFREGLRRTLTAAKR